MFRIDKTVLVKGRLILSEKKFNIWWDEDERIVRACALGILDELIVARSISLRALAQQIWSSGGFIIIGLFWLLMNKPPHG
jgi:hypothetical protein